MHFNIINPELIDLHLQRKCPRLTSLLRQCLGRALRREHTALRLLTDRPIHSPLWLTPERFGDGGHYYEFVGPDRTTTDKCLTIEHWLRTAIADKASWLDNLDGKGRVVRLLHVGTLHHALNLARKDAHERRVRLDSMARLARAALDDGYTALCHSLDRGTTLELCLPDRLKWLRLRTFTALRREGGRMRHCLGNGPTAAHFETGQWSYYSLRDVSVRQSVLTAAAHGHRLVTVLGYRNAAPKRALQPAIDALKTYIDRPSLTWLGPQPKRICRTWRETWEDGHVEHAGNLHHMFGEQPLKLPRILRVTGTLALTRHTGLVALPDILDVGHSLLAGGATNLRTMPRWMRVNGNVDLTGCQSLTALSPKMWVGHNLYINGCHGLRHLPSKLYVAGRLHMEGTGIRRLPPTVHVGRGVSFGRLTFATVEDANHYLEHLAIARPQQP